MKTGAMKTTIHFLLVFLLSAPSVSLAQVAVSEKSITASSLLKSVLFDFDGLTVGDTDLPDGDFGSNDLQYEIAENPAGENDMLGDRVLKLQLNWQSGSGVFGKATSRFFELNVATDKLNFYFLNTAGAAIPVKIILTEDDDNNNYFEFWADDRWIFVQQIPAAAGWQLFSIPLSNFYDDNSGGNGIFDASYTGAGGMLFSVSFHFQKTQNMSHETHYMDMITFTEGEMPHGAEVTQLPDKTAADYCELGALAYTASADQIPSEIEDLFNDGKKIKYVNWFMYYSENGTTPNEYPGQEVENLLQAGYTPIITWEAMFSGYARLDPVQPRLDKILNGTFDAYIDAFADRIKLYSDTVILRIFHEFEGDWYPWSLTQNGHDPTTYIAAFRYVVDRFRARGATNVSWMWCLNADTKPWLRYNWVVAAYPGDDYVDIVATDIYNHPNTGMPAWKSFRFTMAESYYYLRKYFPHKPLYVCEVGCRERYSGENTASQTKAEWLCMMDKDLQSFFCKTRALIFFSVLKEHDWRLNSSEPAKAAFQSCFWEVLYYGGAVGSGEILPESNTYVTAFPNPFSGEINLKLCGKSTNATCSLNVFDVSGKRIYSVSNLELRGSFAFGSELGAGIYIIEIFSDEIRQKLKVVKAIP
jgi:hypothetical protein